jgi:tetratricopeptide (TPR) repeat protein
MSARAVALVSGAARLALGGALVWSAMRGAGLPRPGLSTETARELWESAHAEQTEGRADKALSSVKRLLASFPDNPIYLSFAADLYSELKDPAREAAALEQFLATAPFPSDACPRLGDAYRAQGLAAKALDAHLRCLALRPGQSDLLYFVGRELELEDKSNDAADYFRKALTRSPTFPDALLGLARLSLASGDLAAADKVVSQVLARSPENTDALLTAARVAEKRGDWSAACRHLEAAVRVSPSYAELYRMLARDAERVGDHEMARKAGETLRELEAGGKP